MKNYESITFCSIHYAESKYIFFFTQNSREVAKKIQWIFHFFCENFFFLPKNIFKQKKIFLKKKFFLAKKIVPLAKKIKWKKISIKKILEKKFFQKFFVLKIFGVFQKIFTP